MKAVLYPDLLIDEFPLTDKGRETVLDSRKTLASLLSPENKDDRLLVIVGPCSIHDPAAALDYADLLKEQIERLSKDLFIVMRVYFEKPRTTIGWKGLVNDPHLDSTFNINIGLKTARQLLIDLNSKGVPCATEYLDCLLPQFLSDAICWGAIGARTTESQLHRELASGLSMPVGFKNGTNGDVQIAIDAVKAACHQHCFLSITKQGTIAIVETSGNADCHIILRGGSSDVNYHAKAVQSAIKRLREEKLQSKVLIDCSHGNSQKNFKNQWNVCTAVAEQVESASSYANDILGVMIESNLCEGRQHHTPGVTDRATLSYGVSITDECIGWEETVAMLDRLALSVHRRRQNIYLPN